MKKEEFVNRSTLRGVDSRENRGYLVNHFSKVSSEVVCAHCESDAYYMAEYLLANQDLSGPFIEFGCFNGGMSCKLSEVCGLLNKKYIIFDTFSGLPSSALYKTYDANRAYLGDFKEGAFSCAHSEVVSNLEKFGNLSVCEFHIGLIEETLGLTDYKPSCCFIDVDIISTARFILKSIVPRLEGNLIFTHESCVSDYMDAILDEGWWREMGRVMPHNGIDYKTGLPNLAGSMCLTYLMF